MADSQKYTAGETLCRVLNAGEDALKVDIDNVTLITEGSDINIEVHTDKAEDSMMMWTHTVKTGTGGTSYVPLIDSDGHLQVDTLSSALPSGAATAANQATIIGHVDGLETLITSTNSKIDTLDAVQDNALTKLGEIETTNNANQVLLGTIDSDTDAIKTSLGNIDNSVDGNFLNVNMNLAGSDAQAGEGTISATTQRVTIATDDDGVAHLATIAGAVSTQMQVDVVAALPAGNNNIGNVDIVTLPASTNTIEVVGDVAENENAAGNPVLIGGRYDNSGTNDGGLRTLDTTDVGALALDPKGVLLTKDFTGQAGSILVTGTGAVAAGYGKFIAIQFLEDTIFASGASGLSATDVNRWPDDTGIGSDISSNGAAIDGVTFPQGMTIFGRWDGFTLTSTGSVIAYIGYV